MGLCRYSLVLGAASFGFLFTCSCWIPWVWWRWVYRLGAACSVRDFCSVVARWSRLLYWQSQIWKYGICKQLLFYQSTISSLRNCFSARSIYRRWIWSLPRTDYSRWLWFRESNCGQQYLANQTKYSCRIG